LHRFSRKIVNQYQKIVVGDVMLLSLSFDHRINDGLQATRFVTAVQKLLEGMDPAGTLV